MIETTAVLDRFENDRAVLVLDGDHAIGEVVCDPGRLPAENRETDAVFAVRVADGEVQSAIYRPDETARRRERARRRFDSLSSRLGGSSDDSSTAGDGPTEAEQSPNADESTDTTEPNESTDTDERDESTSATHTTSDGSEGPTADGCDEAK